MISDEELDLMKRQNERNAKYLHRMGRDGVRANRHRTALLSEVDRQRAEIERLRADLDLEKSRIVLQRGEIERLRAENEALHEALRRGDGDRFVVERRTTGPDTPVSFIMEGKP